ncbi:MAG: bifunctional phosphoglucose/phosphomannose isomerase [Armatimonadetes bacterium]|nr:bifunctional phosphoglucose/phosphomannose isomerase [Armatimonadota bacterium]
MQSLDDRATVERLDPGGMLRLAEKFPDQCREALEIALATSIEPLKQQPNVVVLAGLGGSAAGGDLTKVLFEADGTVPFSVNREYDLPKFVDRRSLLFAVSYSGNTEETLAAYDAAKGRGARVIAITSGGELAERASACGDEVIKVPGGQPPRTALGYLFVPVASACVQLDLLSNLPFDAAFRALDEGAKLWGVEPPESDNTAKQIARSLHRSVGLLYGLGSWQAIVANRWKGQINENAKNMAFANAFPELCHNEILGWVKADGQGVDRWTTIMLEDGTESEKMRARARVTAQLIAKTTSVHSAQAIGGTLLEKALSLTYMGDFVSLYLASLNGVDPESIDSINTLKSELAKID